MVALGLVDEIVVAYDVVLRSQRVVDFPVVVPRGECLRHGARAVDGAYVVAHLACPLHGILRLALYDFIAYGPAEDAGVVAVAAHHHVEVVEAPLVEQLTVVVVGLLLAPAVERLVDDQQSQLVAGIKERGRRRVVTGAHGVEASLLEQAHLAQLGVVVGRSAKQSVVVMHAGTEELDGLAVEQQPVLGVPVERAHAEAHRLLFKSLATGHQPRVGPVELRRVGRPQLDVRETERLLHLLFSTGVELHRLAHLAGTVDVNHPLELCRLRRRVLNDGLHHHGARVGRLHPHAVVLEVHLFLCQEPHVAVDACAAVPARVALMRVVHVHADGVLPLHEEARDVHKERRVAVGMPAGQLAVDVDRRVHVDALEVELHPLMQVGIFEFELLDIPRRAVLPVAAVAGTDRIAVQRQGDAPVVRQRHLFPALPVIHLTVYEQLVTQVEHPPLVKPRPLRYVVLCRCCQRRYSQQCRHAHAAHAP